MDILLNTAHPSGEELAGIYAQLQRVKGEINLGWARQLVKVTPQTIHLSDAEAFNLNIEEHCFFAASPTFLSFPDFEDVGNCIVYSEYAMLLLVNCCTLLRIFYF